MYEPELGQLTFSNGNFRSVESPDFVEAGLEVIAQGVAVKRGDDTGWGLLISNSGAEGFENETFSMTSYCWCDGDVGHEGGCPPNFLHKPSGLQVDWYKHCGRGRSQSTKVSLAQWLTVVGDCMRSLGVEA